MSRHRDGGDALAWSRAHLGDALWSDLAACHGEGVLAALPSFGAILLTPDFFEQDLIEAFLPWLARWRASPVAAVPHAFPRAVAHAEYARAMARHQRPHRPSGWLSPELYGMGACMLIVLRSEDRAPSLLERIGAAKGTSEHARRDLESVRGMSPILERHLSLLHAPDTYEDFFDLGGLLLGVEGLGGALTPDRPAIPAGALVALLRRARMDAEQHPFDVVLQLLERGLALMVGDPRVPPLPVLGAALDAVGRSRAALPAAALARASREELRGRLGELAAPTRAVADALLELAPARRWDQLRWLHARQELGALLADACARAPFDAVFVESLVETFERNHLPVAPWTRHRLHVLASFYGRTEHRNRALRDEEPGS